MASWASYWVCSPLRRLRGSPSSNAPSLQQHPADSLGWHAARSPCWSDEPSGGVLAPWRQGADGPAPGAEPVHSWDLARAIGVDHALEFVVPNAERFVEDGVFPHLQIQPMNRCRR